MKMNVFWALTVSATLLASQGFAADLYKIDPAHTSVAFSVRHMGVSNVKGHFDDFTGSLLLDGSTLKEAQGVIQVKSVNTGIEARDKHLRTADFFDATNHPTIVFKSKRVEQSGGQTVLVADFTLRGVTNEIRLPVELSGPVKDMQGKERVGLEAKSTINRQDYGLNFGGKLESGEALVGDKVTLEISAEAVKDTTEKK
jgi:polyisoprenoid-binding protein YceI